VIGSSAALFLNLNLIVEPVSPGKLQRLNTSALSVAVVETASLKSVYVSAPFNAYEAVTS